MAPTRIKDHLVIAISSETSLLEINGVPSFIRVLQALKAVWPTAPISICVEEKYSTEVKKSLEREEIESVLHICDATSGITLGNSLVEEIENSENLLLHDGSQQIASPDVYKDLVDALADGADATRPFIPFTETLKFVNERNEIEETLDRNSVKRILNPQIIRTSVIDLSEELSSWFLPLKSGARAVLVEGKPG